MKVWFSFLLIMNFSASAVSENCLDLFKINKIVPSQKDCELHCSSVKVDMSTFTCHDQCEEYCIDPCKKNLQEIEKNVLSGQPKGWPLKEKKASWTASEKRSVVMAISRIPEELKGKDAFQVYRMLKSVDFPNPATNIKNSLFEIVLYDTVFTDKYDLTTVLVHEFAHNYYQNMPSSLKESYNLKMNWFLVDPAKDKWISRKDGFVEEDGRVSPEEDFANNVEYFLLKSEKLKNINSNAYDWIKTNIGNIKLQKGCRYDN